MHLNSMLITISTTAAILPLLIPVSISTSGGTTDAILWRWCGLRWANGTARERGDSLQSAVGGLLISAIYVQRATQAREMDEQ